MIKYPITESVKSILQLCMKEPIFKHLIGTYETDENFVYIPEERFKNKDVLKSLINSGAVFKD